MVTRVIIINMKAPACGHSFAATEHAIDTIARRLPGSPREEVVLTRLLLHIQPLLLGYFNQSLAVHDMNETTWMALMVLYAHPEEKLMPSELSDALAFSRTNATRVVDDLVTRGLIRRQPCGVDRRRTYLELTDSGLAFIERVMPGQRQQVRELWAVFDNEERAQLEALLRKLMQQLGG